ncbi:MAG: helix-turn-helix domain-containing protein, partial [Oscillospiraceae bacterium]
LQRLRHQIDTEREEKRSLEMLSRRYQESLPLLREQFYTRLLDGRIDPQRMTEQAALYDVGLDGDCWVAALAHFDPPVDGEESAIAQRELLPLSVQQLLDENLAVPGCCFKTSLYNDTVAVLAGFHGADGVYDVIDAINRVCKLARSYLGLPLTVGVGAPCQSLSELYLSAAGARSALDYRVLMGAGRVIYIADLEPDYSAQLAFDDADEQELTSAIKLGGEEKIRAAIDRLMSRVRDSRLALSKCHCFFLELVSCLMKLTRSSGLELEEVFGEEFTGAVLLTDFNSPGELGHWCLERCQRIAELIRRQRSDSTRRTVERAKEFIEAHYADEELAVETLCDHLHLSPAYFSTVFKRETGMSFTNYVTAVRMDTAAGLLRESDDKTYIIAQKIGYTDANYFSYVFKKHFGVSPSRYRAGQ